MPAKKKERTEDENTFLRNIGFRVGYFRKLRELSQQELADISGVSLNSISHIESTSIVGISLITLYRLASALNIDTKQLLTFD